MSILHELDEDRVLNEELNKLRIQVVVLLGSSKKEIYFLDEGYLMGHHVPPSGYFHEIGMEIPKIYLKKHKKIIWGHDCYWIRIDHFQQFIGNRLVIQVTPEFEKVDLI